MFEKKSTTHTKHCGHNCDAALQRCRLCHSVINHDLFETGPHLPEQFQQERSFGDEHACIPGVRTCGNVCASRHGLCRRQRVHRHTHVRQRSITARPPRTRRSQYWIRLFVRSAHWPGFPSIRIGLPSSSAAIAVRITSSRARCVGPSGRWKTFWLSREESCVVDARGNLFWCVCEVGVQWVV